MDVRAAAGRGRVPPCTFWYADTWPCRGDARRHAIFERLLGLRNDVGLITEEYDPGRRAVGNFPQAFSHIGLITPRYILDRGQTPRAV